MSFTKALFGLQLLTLLLTALHAGSLQAGIIFEPYYSFSSTKSIMPQHSSGTQTETISKREEKGLRAGLSFYRLWKLVASVGESYHVSTSSVSALKDEYGEIDFSQDLNSSTSGQQQKKKEFQRRASVNLSLDPSFSIFIMRAKLGVVARQRLIELFVDDVSVAKENPQPTYKPQAGAGFGIKFTPNIYALAEYGFYFYKFPETKPFERELTVSYGFSF